MNLIILNDISKSIILGTDFLDQEKITISIPLGGWFTDLNLSSFTYFDYQTNSHTKTPASVQDSEPNLMSFDDVTIDSEDYHNKSPATVLAAWSSPYENLKDWDEIEVNNFSNLYHPD